MDEHRIYFFTRIGGKSKIAPKIIQYFPPDYDTYVEPFVGSGQVFLRLDISKKKKYILNDLDRDIYDLWNDLKKIEKKQIEKLPWHGNKNLFMSLKHSVYDNPVFRFYRNLYLHFYSFSGDKTSGYCSKHWQRGKGFFKTFDILKEKMRNVRVYQKDYKKIIEKFDDHGVLFYLDPPYMGKSHLYDDLAINPFELEKIVRNMKGKFILSYNDNVYIKKIFHNYKMIRIKVPYTSGKNKDTQHELLITNF